MYRKLSSLGEINMRIGSGSHEERQKLTGSDQNQRQQHEHSETMANDGQSSSEAQMLLQNGSNFGFLMENRSEIFKPNHLKPADETKQNANEKED